MWSVWSERIDLYLGQGLAMVKTMRHSERVIKFAATLPMDRVLERVGQEIQAMGIAKGRMRGRLHVTLSGSLCPASAFLAPDAVNRWDELRSFAQASAASALGVAADEIVSETDRYCAGIVASVGRTLLDDLSQWAITLYCSIASVRPLWATASDCPAAGSANIKGVLVSEPDAQTLVAVGQGGTRLASTLLGGVEAGDNRLQIRRWLVGAGLSESDILQLALLAVPQSLMPRGPDAWAGHWCFGTEAS